MLTLLNLLLALFIPLTLAENKKRHYTCTPSECVQTDTSIQLGIELRSSSSLNLLPGSYTSDSAIARLLPAVSFTYPLTNVSQSSNADAGAGTEDHRIFGEIEPYPHSSWVFNRSVSATGSGSGSGTAGDTWPLIINHPESPLWFAEPRYGSQPRSLPLLPLPYGASNTSTGTIGSWQSLYLPLNTYLYFPPSSSSSSSSSSSWSEWSNLQIHTSIPYKQNLGPALSKSTGDLGRAVWASYDCDPPCGNGGICQPVFSSSSSSSNSSLSSSSPSNSSRSLGSQCTCKKGYTGQSCTTCLPNHYGPDCSPCPDQCFLSSVSNSSSATGSGTGVEGTGAEGKCDDGIAGTGGCLGVVGNSSSSCGCLYGTCTSSNSCACSAGYADPPQGQGGKRCSVCALGFGKAAGGCVVCPLGTLQCDGPTPTCVSGYKVDLGTGLCAPLGTAASCIDGQYWDGAGCSMCSPACQTCTGPGSGECLRCASPRFNLNGTCVGYDPSSGICDSTGTTLSGVYVADNTAGRCDACPQGCLECAIPNFSITATKNDTRCTACQEGWVLQGDKCVQGCGKGFFLPVAAPNLNGTCQACDTTKCSTCFTTSTQCATCADPTLFATSDGSCVTTCPTGTYISTSSKRCISCPSDCATCSEDGQCLTCPSTAPLLKKGRCSTMCGPSLYWDSSLIACKPCTSLCSSCIGPEANQCVTCSEGSIMKGGSCYTPSSCTPVPGLGICLRSDISKETLWWPYVLVVGFLLGILGMLLWWIRRTRRHRREETAAFAATVDDNEVNKRIQGMGGLFKMLNTMRMNEKTPVRESFYSAGNTLAPPPAYSPSDNKHRGSFELMVPSPTLAGPPRVPIATEDTKSYSLEEFVSSRPLSKRSVSFADQSVWFIDKKDSRAFSDTKDRGNTSRKAHCQV